MRFVPATTGREGDRSGRRTAAFFFEGDFVLEDDAAVLLLLLARVRALWGSRWDCEWEREERRPDLGAAWLEARTRRASGDGRGRLEGWVERARTGRGREC